MNKTGRFFCKFRISVFGKNVNRDSTSGKKMKVSGNTSVCKKYMPFEYIQTPQKMYTILFEKQKSG